MIAAWMLAATAFALLLGVAAAAIEYAMRLNGREGRGAWRFALVAAIGWPAAAPALATLFARSGGSDVSAIVANGAPAVGPVVPALPSTDHAWLAYLNVALAALWVATSITLVVRLLWAMRTLSRVERSATSSIIDGVSVLVTPTHGPAVFGARRQRVLIPQWILELDAPLRELVLRHEQEHCHARDARLTLAAAVAIALVPWNCGVWWISRRLRLAIELDCDTRVLRATADRERYSKLLFFIAQRQLLVRLAPMLAESNSDLSRRIEAMHAPRFTNLRARIAAVAIVAAGALIVATRFAGELTAAPRVPTLGAQAATPSVVAPVAPGAQSGLVAQAFIDSTPLRKREVAGQIVRRVLKAPADSSAPATTLRRDGDSPVRAIPGSPSPRYPQILKTAGLEGVVLIAFVVDTNGVPDPGTIHVEYSSHQLFSDAVTGAIPNMKFLPATVNYVKVRQVVQLPIEFNIWQSPEEEQAAQVERRAAMVIVAAASGLPTIGGIIITGVTQP